MLTLVSSRLRLRQLREPDLNRMMAFYAEKESHPHVLRHQRDPEKMGRVLRFVLDNSQFLEKKSGSLHLAVEIKDSGELIGMCHLENARVGKAANLGWHFGSGYSGRGYATEAAAELMKYAWTIAGVSSVSADCFESNRASLRVFEKLGMAPVPFLWMKKYLYAIRYGEWRPIVRWVRSPRTIPDVCARTLEDCRCSHDMELRSEDDETRTIGA